MKLSPLQLDNYFVIESHVTASRDFNPAAPSDVRAEEIIVTRDIKPTDENRHWEVTLRIQFTPGPGVNTPYFFTLEIVGLFHADPEYLEERLDRLVKTNGPTILFGIAREVIRNLTAHGPHAPMLLPTASFVLDPSAEPQKGESPSERSDSHESTSPSDGEPQTNEKESA